MDGGNGFGSNVAFWIDRSKCGHEPLERDGFNIAFNEWVYF